MRYDFSCKTCNHLQALSFPMVDYDNYVYDEEELHGLHKIELCEKCGTKSLYRHITKENMPNAGAKNSYVSMEKYWAQNPGLVRKHEDELAKKMDERHRKRVTDRINKQRKLLGKEQRHEGYGKGQGEQRLTDD